MSKSKIKLLWYRSLWIAALLCCPVLKAQEVKDIHYTTLLPLVTNLSQEDEKILEKRVVDRLSKENFILYKSHDEFYKILKNQGGKLKNALYNDDVLKVISKKLLVGSMVRLEVNEFLLGYEVILDIINNEAKSIYHRKKVINQKSIVYLSGIVDFWIQRYIKDIPFDATIIEVQAENLLIDFPGKNEALYPNRQFVVIRETDKSSKKRDEYEEIAYGVVSEINDDFFLGKLLQTKTDYIIDRSDLIQFKVFDEEIAKKNPDYKYRKHDLGNYRDVGKVSLYGSLTKVKGDQATADFIGATLALDFFLPSQLLLMFEFSRKVGETSAESETDSNTSSTSLNDNSYKALIGYTFSPETFKYISYIDIYAGWSMDQHYLAGLGILGVGDVSFEGPVVGLRLEHPIYPNLSALSGFEYSIKPQFKEKERTILGEAESSTGYIFQLGMRYRFDGSGFSTEVLFRRKGNSADIKNSNRKLNLSNNQIMLGVSKFF